MRRSNKLKLCLLAMLAASVAFAAAACGEDDHEHTASDAWAFDAEEHWHPASCSHDVKLNKSAHQYEEIVVPPSGTSGGYTLHICACGYSYTSDPTSPTAPAQPGEAGYRFNEEGHWKIVTGEEDTREIVPHDYTDETVAPTCTAAGYIKHVCACGYWYASDPTDPIAHTTDEDIWEHNGTEHWHPCLVCGMQTSVTAHTYEESVTLPTCDAGGYTQFTCTDCGYTFRGRETAASHHFADTLESDEYEHWRPADCGHEARTDVEMHFFEGNSDTCSVCGKQIQPRISYALSADRSYYIVTGIGSFAGTELVIPDDINGRPVREVAARAFKNTGVTSLTLGANVEKIGAEAFRGLAINTLSLPDSVKEIGAKAFMETEISTLTLGEKVESIGQGAFQNCTSLTSATLNSAVLETLPYYLFAGCTQLQTVGGTTKVKTVRAQAFNGCAALERIDLSACTNVEFSAFGGCTALTEITSFAALAAAEQYAFAESGLQGALAFPALKNVADNMFEGCTALQSVTLAAESVGVSAFKGCSGLNSVTAGAVLKTVGEEAFAGCAQLTSLTLPETVIRVGVNAFKDTGLITAENGVNYAANVAVGLASGTTAALKAGTVGVADEAFKETAITSATLPESVRFIGVNAFRKCEGLTAIEFKGNVKYIGANSFRESGLTAVTVPATVLSVGDNAFYDCMSLATVSVSAKQIGKFAFSYTGVGRTLNSPVKQRPEGASLTSLTIGAGVEKIGSNAFQYAPITQVTLPATLKELGGYAFAQTDLAGVTIPAAVTRIGAYAFYGCTKLTSATFAATAGWTAGGRVLNLATPATNATYLKTTYNHIEWVRG